MVVPVRIDRSQLQRPGRYSGVVTDSARSFRLVTTVIVLDTGRISVRSRKLPGGQAARWFVAVPAGGTLSARAVLRGDTSTPAQLSIFEPNGRPLRSGESPSMGGEAGATAAVTVNRNDAVAGIYEVAVQAMPGHEITYDLDIVTSPVTLTADSATGGVSLTSPRDTTLTISFEHLGADTTFTTSIDRGATWTRPFAVPSWARHLMVEVQAGDGWLGITDLAISVMGMDGERLGGGAMNYSYHREKVDIAGGRPTSVVVELFPGFALPLPTGSLPLRMRVTFMPERPMAVGAPAPIRLAPGVRTPVSPPAFTSLASPGWADRLRINGADIEVPVRRR